MAAAAAAAASISALAVANAALLVASRLYPDPAAPAPTPGEVRRAIAGNLSSFFRVMDLSDQDVKSLPLEKARQLQRLQLHALLGVQERLINGPADAVTSFTKLRDIFLRFPWIKRDGDITKHLSTMRVVCDVCYLYNSKVTAVILRAQKLKNHEDKSKTHKRALARTIDLREKAAAASDRGVGVVGAASGATRVAGLPPPAAAASSGGAAFPASPPLSGVKRRRQARLVDVGMAEVSAAAAVDRARALFVAMMVAGGRGAAGIPYSSIPLLLSTDALRLLRAMPAGIPAASTIRTNDVPKAVLEVKAWIKSELREKVIALAIDGGSSHLVNGMKVVAVTAVSPALQHDVLIGLDIRVGHEDAKSQAAFLLQLKEEYGLDTGCVPYLAADNASVNPSTARVLRKGGWQIEHVRCVPHCLNLVIRAFCDVFSDTFGMQSHLRDIRSFILAGGGNSRRALLVEWGVTLSGIDFADTRWSGFVQAVVYMMSVQSTAELAAAAKRLKELAAAGDKTAEEALDADDAPQIHWNAVYEAIEEIHVEARGAVFGSHCAALLIVQGFFDHTHIHTYTVYCRS